MISPTVWRRPCCYGPTFGKMTLDEIRIDLELLKQVNKMIVLAGTTIAYAGTMAKYVIENWCRIPTEVELDHEFRYRDPTVVVSLSQSGETTDVRYAREQSAKTDLQHKRFDHPARV